MKAIAINAFGDTGVFEEIEVPVPEPGPGQVRIRVQASSVNPIDIKIRSGLVPALCPPFPAVLHADAAGIVDAVGEGVREFQPGDAVMACLNTANGPGGALAEFALADAAAVSHKPASVSVEDAAAIPLAALTAWEALMVRVTLQPGQKVLVHGGAGGVGHIAVQLAKARGAEVFTTVSSDAKADLVSDLGADAAINYRSTSLESYLARHTGGRGFDVVMDTVGGGNLQSSLAAFRGRGTVVTINARATVDLSQLHARGGSLLAVFLVLDMLTPEGRKRLGAALREVSAMVDDGRLRPLVDPEIFGFREAGKAHEKLESGAAIGKIRMRQDLG